MISDATASRPRVLPIGIALALAVALASAVIWWRESSSTDPAHFDSCRFEGESIVLTWTNGSGDAVTTSVAPSPDEIVVRLSTKSPAGPSTAIGLIGEARYAVTGAPRAVRHADGTPLACPAA